MSSLAAASSLHPASPPGAPTSSGLAMRAIMSARSWVSVFWYSAFRATPPPPPLPADAPAAPPKENCRGCSGGGRGDQQLSSPTASTCSNAEVWLVTARPEVAFQRQPSQARQAIPAPPQAPARTCAIAVDEGSMVQTDE